MSLASPHHENPNCLVLNEDGRAPSPATSLVTDARPDIASMDPNFYPGVPPDSSIVGTSPVSVFFSSTGGKVGLPEAIVQHQSLEDLPNEVLFHIMGFLDVNDLLSTSRDEYFLSFTAPGPILGLDPLISAFGSKAFGRIFSRAFSVAKGVCARHDLSACRASHCSQEEGYREGKGQGWASAMDSVPMET
ncbi:hypothetical protein FPOAC1_008318 [Fusarium poae]|uniref:hypothetical protein n=1 Tax=Fusarium poae TaxID=36050 RepID=UPI001CE7ABBE|nr:hypothetical protein FPOAC1_008318 [Fusarium poae]KAG8668934.1 hypothetical protein FPOAC1_008318 [Fusarium poae]